MFDQNLLHRPADRLRIAVVSISPRIVTEAGRRTLDLVGRILRSQHGFAGLRQVLPDTVGLAGMLDRWIADERVDIVLIVDECADIRPSGRHADALTAVAPAAEACTAVIDDPAIGFIGVLDMRALRDSPSA